MTGVVMSLAGITVEMGGAMEDHHPQKTVETA